MTKKRNNGKIVAIPSSVFSLCIGLGVLLENLQFLKEGVDILKLAVNRCKAHVCNLVALAQLAHDDLAKVGGCDLLTKGVLQLGFDLVNKKNRVDGTLLCRLEDACQELLLIEQLLASALFDNEYLLHLKRFKSSEAFLAVLAFATATDAVALNSGARVDYLAFRKTTTRTSHNCVPMRPTVRTLLFSKILY